MRTPKAKRNQTIADAMEINRLLDGATAAERRNRRPLVKRPLRKAAPLPKNSDELCKRLVCIAAFSLADNPEAQKMIYLAVRTLQRMDMAAKEDGILPSDSAVQPIMDKKYD